MWHRDMEWANAIGKMMPTDLLDEGLPLNFHLYKMQTLWRGIKWVFAGLTSWGNDLRWIHILSKAGVLYLLRLFKKHCDRKCRFLPPKFIYKCNFAYTFKRFKDPPETRPWWSGTLIQGGELHVLYKSMDWWEPEITEFKVITAAPFSIYTWACN